MADECRFCKADWMSKSYRWTCGTSFYSGRFNRSEACYDRQIEQLQAELQECREKYNEVWTGAGELNDRNHELLDALDKQGENQTALVVLLKDAMAFHKYWLQENLPFDADMSLKHWTLKTEQKLKEL